ncbi:MAG: transcription elongation factor GreA [Candidatus Omnitrophota bacterium]
MDDIYLTQGGYEKLIQELEYLRNVKRKKISEAIAQARAQGDISENAEYDAAKDAQALNEQRISELEDKLARARIIDNEDIDSDEALLGAKVKLKDLDTEEEIEYLLVSELEADYDSGKISVTSPVGKGLLGHKKGEEVEIKIPAGVLRYKILEVTR